MIRKILLPLLMLTATLAVAQSTSKSKSKERFREKDDRRYPIRVENLNIINLPGTDYAPAFYDNGIIFVSARAKRGPRQSPPVNLSWITTCPLSTHWANCFPKSSSLIF
jgi:hypothetical protein